MSTKSDLVLVTGVSGYLGSHIVDQLVRGGIPVRGVVRSAKVSEVQSGYDAAYGSGKVEIVPIDDLVEGDFTSALEGVTALIHVASPLSNRGDPEAILDVAIGGTINVIRQAQKAGVKRFSIASSVVAAMDLNDMTKMLTEHDWNPATKEQALDGTRDKMYVYAASKVLAEKEVWAFANEHPDISFTTVNPTFFIGPYAPGHHIHPGDLNSLSTNLILYNLLIPDSKVTTPSAGFIDVRDVAAAIIRGIKTPGKTRALLTGEWFDLKDAADYIASVRPELKGRLADPARSDDEKGVIDNTRAYDALDLSPVRPWRESVLETIDVLLKVEKDWVAQGVDIENTLKKSDRRQ